MLYTPLTKLALKICFEAHKDQVDKGGLPYVFHPFHLAEQMGTEAEVVVALLHDVMEDTAMTADDLIAAGIPKECVSSLLLMTHDAATPYLDYVATIARDPVARKVKLADLAHNSDLSRLDHEPTPKDLARIEKYRRAIELLSNVDGEGDSDSGGAKLASDSLRDKFEACLLGGAAGDALGYAVEFWGYDSIVGEYGPRGIERYELAYAEGADEPEAIFSDDTQMTLFTAEGLIACAAMAGPDCMGQRPVTEDGLVYADPIPAYVTDAYLDWMLTQEPGFQKAPRTTGRLLAEPRLHSWRAPGNTCMSALRMGGWGTIDRRINHSKGCGGVMRVAPWGLACSGPDERVVRTGAQLAAITHGHPLGWISAGALCHIVSHSAREVAPGCANPRAELVRIVKECASGLEGWFPEEPEEASAMAGLLALALELADNDAPDVDNIETLGGGWVGEQALAIAVYAAVRHADDFSGALVAAVNHSGDSDSTGAICGNILGALLGTPAIGWQWFDDLELKDLIVEIADDLFEASSETSTWETAQP